MPMLDVDGISLYYTDKGKGVPIIFIHPPVITSVDFKYQIEELSQKFRVITFDIRGHGRSQYSKQPITYPLIVKDIKHLMDHLNLKKAFICGYSTGGTIVLEFLLTSADRALGGIIISGMSELSDLYIRSQVSIGAKLAKAGAISALALPISWSNSNTKKLFKEMFKEALKGDARNIEQYFQYCLDYNCTNKLEKIDHPILLVYGKKDKPFKYYAKLLHERLPSNEIKFIANADHRIPTKAATELNEMIKQFVYSHNDMNSEDTFRMEPKTESEERFQ
jgi:pimeloyl-ACP methyl ester carboxylesterase